MLRRPLALAVAGVLAGTLVPAAAEAKRFRGTTEQGRRAIVSIGSDQHVRIVKMRWSAPCRHGNFRRHPTIFLRPFDSATPDAFSDDGTYRVRQRGGIRLRITVKLDGHRRFDPAQPARERWSGTLSGKALVTRSGRWHDTCEVTGLSWSARLVR